MNSSTHHRIFFVSTVALLVAACTPAPPVADDENEKDQVEEFNYLLTHAKDAWTEHLVLPPVDELVQRAWVPTSAGPGCAVGLVEGGEITYLKGYGMASMGDAGDGPPEAWSYKTVAPVGSIAKTITALSFRLLESEWGNQLNLSDTVNDHLPTNGTLANVPMTDLLSHASGAKKSPSWESGALPGNWDLSHPRTPFAYFDDVVGALGSPKYSNLGYTVLGAVIDELTHDAFWLPFDTRGYEAYTWQRVGRYMADDTYEGQMLSLALTHSWRVAENDIPHYAHGYKLNGDLYDAWDEVGNKEGWEGPSGGWVMTIGDLSRLVAALMKNEIVGETTLTQMSEYETNVLGGYGQGIATEAGAMLWHGGDIAGHAAVWALWPDASPKPFGVALICNRAGAGFIATDLLDVARDIRSLYASANASPANTLPPAGEAAAADVDNGSYLIDMSTARVTQPRGFFLPLADAGNMMLQVKAESNESLALTLVQSATDTGRLGKATALGSVPYRSGQSFRTSGDANIEFSAAGLGTVKAHNFALEAAFAGRGKHLTSVIFSAIVDARDLDAMANDGWRQICANHTTRVDTCQPCGDGQPACIAITAEWMVGKRQPLD